MNAFAQAAADLHADANLGVEATYCPVGGPTVALRVSRVQPVEPIGLSGPGAPRASMRNTQFSLPAAALATDPVKGDTLQVEGREIYTVQEKQLDAERTTWTLTCSAVPA